MMPSSSANANDASRDDANDILSDKEFQSKLRNSLDFYQLPLDYDIFLIDSVSSGNSQVASCIVSLSTEEDDDKGFVQIQFPDKENFVLSKIKTMVFATVFILLFTIGVLLGANWMLIRQKHVLQTNIDFFNNMAHEFRTPLTNLGLATNMLVRKHQALTTDAVVSVMKFEISGLLNQVERILDIASIEEGDHQLQKESIRVVELLDFVKKGMTMRLEQQGATLVIGPFSDDLTIVGDKLHLSNVFRNLIDNALKYSGGQPKISIDVEQKAKGVLISVRDNGVGFPSGANKLIFEKFQRAKSTGTQNQKGFGVGLAYVKKMVERHKGFVRATSEENQGSSFDVYLPNVAS
jgi:signal transduction histidine kinase